MDINMIKRYLRVHCIQIFLNEQNWNVSVHVGGWLYHRLTKYG